MYTKNKLRELIDNSKKIRRDIIKISHLKKISHLASSLSCVEILTFVYSQLLTKYKNSTFILSKGHAASALYNTLYNFRLMSKKVLDSYNNNGSILAEHPPAHGKIKNIFCATGSLGHGMPIAAGLATSKKILKQKGLVIALVSDGECNEGSIWETAMYASKKELNNFITFIDFNKWQATGRSKDILNLDKLDIRWKSFGWDCLNINGHDYGQFFHVEKKIHNLKKPLVIICNTIKGKGVSFMEDNNNWHYRIPDKKELYDALEQLR